MLQSNGKNGEACIWDVASTGCLVWTAVSGQLFRACERATIFNVAFGLPAVLCTASSPETLILVRE